MQIESRIKELKSTLKGEYTLSELEPIVKELIADVGSNPSLVGKKLKLRYLIRLKKPYKLTSLFPSLFNDKEDNCKRLKNLLDKRIAQLKKSPKDYRLKIIIKSDKSKLHKAELEKQKSINKKLKSL